MGLKHRHRSVEYWDSEVKRYRKKLRGNIPKRDEEVYERELHRALEQYRHFRKYYRGREREVGRFESGRGNYGGHFNYDR